MSFVGGSISQAAAISGAEGRLTAVEALAGTKVAQAAYDAKVVLLDAKDAEHDAALIALGGRATALESDLSGRVQAEINDKVAQGVFDSLASELRSADSALTAALATKVAATTQASVDSLQDSAIATKASIDGVNDALNGLVSQFNAEIIRLDGVDASKVNTSDYDAMVVGLQGVDADHDGRLGALEAIDAGGRLASVESAVSVINGTIANNIMPHLTAHDGNLAALEEFVSVLLRTYAITKPNGSPYAYTGSVQGL